MSKSLKIINTEYLPTPIVELFDAIHLRFEHIGYTNMSDGSKINAYRVLNKHDDFVLGTIEWFPKWRIYAFFPKEHTCYEQDCLRDIADFCEQCKGMMKND